MPASELLAGKTALVTGATSGIGLETAAALSSAGFFADALALREKYDIVGALTAAGYPPSNTAGFTLTQMNAALAAAYGPGVLARVSCDAKGFIQELVVCFDKQLQPLACDIAASPGACKQATTRTLYLPATMTATV